MRNGRILLFTTCTNRKRNFGQPIPRASSLSPNNQQALLNQWLSRLSQERPTQKASEVYCGRAFSEICKARDESSGHIWIISAGLGLVSENDPISCYNLTIGDSGPDSIRKKVVDEPFSPARWWHGLGASRNLINPISELVKKEDPKLAIFALSKAYAALIQQDLLSLSNIDLEKVRIIGVAVRGVLDERLQRLVMPYDERFDGPDGLSAGTRSDFSARAMRHFASLCQDERYGGQSPEDHKRLINEILDGRRFPVVPKRRRATDDEIKAVFLKHMHTLGRNSSKMLRVLRDTEKIACEQSRCARILEMINQERGSE